MRRRVMTFVSLLFSILALGGSNAAILCLHGTGDFHVTSASHAESAESADEGWELNEVCNTGFSGLANECLDVLLEGLDLAEVWFEGGNDLVGPAFAFVCITFPRIEWDLPVRLPVSRPVARAPPALAQALIVSETTVLLL